MMLVTVSRSADEVCACVPMVRIGFPESGWMMSWLDRMGATATPRVVTTSGCAHGPTRACSAPAGWLVHRWGEACMGSRSPSARRQCPGYGRSAFRWRFPWPPGPACPVAGALGGDKRSVLQSGPRCSTACPHR